MLKGMRCLKMLNAQGGHAGGLVSPPGLPHWRLRNLGEEKTRAGILPLQQEGGMPLSVEN